MQSTSYGPFKDDGWLAGFIDGEGSFFIISSGAHYQPRFSLGQSVRWRSLVEELNSEFGGHLSSERPATGGKYQISVEDRAR